MNSSLKNRGTFFIAVFLVAMLFSPPCVFVQEKMEDISIDFVDADLADVVRVLATSQNLNYIIGEEVIAKVTIKLEDVSFDTALNAAITSNGFAYKITENVLYVTTLEKLQEEEKIKNMIIAKQELVTFVFELKYINAVDVIPVLENQLSNRGKIFALKRTILGGYKGGEFSSASSGVKSSQRLATKKEESTRTLIVIDIPTKIEKVQDLIIRLDRMPQQVLIDAKVVEMTLDSTFDFGIKWNFMGGGADGTGGLTVGTSKVSKVITDTLTNTSNRTQDIEDLRALEVNDDADVIRLSTKDKSDNPLSYGAEELFKDSEGLTLITDPDGSGYSVVDYTTSGKKFGSEQTNSDIAEIGRDLSVEDVTTATLSVTDMSVVLNALEVNGDVEIVSNPTILTLHNHEASILVGERYPIIQAETSDVGFTTESLDHYEPIGVHLQVVPRILDNGYINMIVRPAITSLGSPVQGNNISINRISTREASTQAIIRSGETIVIGGLISDRLAKDVSKLPLLGDIPILGWAFKNKRDRVEKINLMIFVTPTIVEREE